MAAMSEYQIAGGIPITWLLSVSGIVLGGVFGLLKWFAGRMIDEIETRLKRITQAVEWLGEGKSLSWKYEKR